MANVGPPEDPVQDWSQCCVESWWRFCLWAIRCSSSRYNFFLFVCLLINVIYCVGLIIHFNNEMKAVDHFGVNEPWQLSWMLIRYNCLIYYLFVRAEPSTSRAKSTERRRTVSSILKDLGGFWGRMCAGFPPLWSSLKVITGGSHRFAFRIIDSGFPNSSRKWRGRIHCRITFARITRCIESEAIFFQLYLELFFLGVGGAEDGTNAEGSNAGSLALGLRWTVDKVSFSINSGCSEIIVDRLGIL